MKRLDLRAVWIPLMWSWLLLVAWPSTAAAQPDRGFGIVTLDLRPDHGDVPTHLCVVTEANSPRTRHRLWDALDLVADSADSPDRNWRVLPWIWAGDDASVEDQRCTDDPLGDCRPRVQLPRGLSRQSDLYVACAADSLTEGGSVSQPRPLFILLEYLEGSPPQVESVRLTGGVATIGVYGPNFDRVVVTARSLGGSYLPQGRSERGQTDPGQDADDEVPNTKTIELHLEARCRTVELRLPRTHLRPEDHDRFSARVHGRELNPDHCVALAVGTGVVQLTIPPAPLDVGSIEVELAATADHAAARFGGTFEGTWPRTPYTLEFTQITFSWQRPSCIYPRDRCPTAILATGTICSANVTAHGCEYSCPGEVNQENAVPLDLPLRVAFEKDKPKQRWEDTLAQNGQVLTSYVPSDQIYVEADLEGWNVGVPDNQVHRVEIYGEDGEARPYGVTGVERLLLKVPGASCESLRFKLVGDRAYEEAVATVDAGSIDFGDPTRSARRLSFNFTIALGGGPAWSGPIDTPPIYFSGLGMFAMQVRPRRRAWNRLAFELRAGVTLGQWATTVIDEEPAPEDPDEDVQETTELRRFGWARVLLEPGLVASLHERVSLGLGVGFGFSLPFRDEEDITNESLTFIWSPNIDFRFRLRRWLALVIQFRGVFGEQAFNAEAGDVDEETARSLLTLFGLQASF